jgi:hypothetical protein
LKRAPSLRHNTYGWRCWSPRFHRPRPALPLDAPPEVLTTYAPAHLLEDSSSPSRGPGRRASDLHRKHKNGSRFAWLSAIRANQGRLASISVSERQSTPIKDYHPPLLNGPIGNPVMDANQTRPPIANGANGNPAREGDQTRPPIGNGENGGRQRQPIRPDHR